MIYHTYKGWRRPWIVAAAAVFSIYLLTGCSGNRHVAMETSPVSETVTPRVAIVTEDLTEGSSSIEGADQLVDLPR